MIKPRLSSWRIRRRWSILIPDRMHFSWTLKECCFCRLQNRRSTPLKSIQFIYIWFNCVQLQVHRFDFHSDISQSVKNLSFFPNAFLIPISSNLTSKYGSNSKVSRQSTVLTLVLKSILELFQMSKVNPQPIKWSVGKLHSNYVTSEIDKCYLPSFDEQWKSFWEREITFKDVVVFSIGCISHNPIFLLEIKSIKTKPNVWCKVQYNQSADEWIRARSTLFHWIQIYVPYFTSIHDLY